LVSLLLLDPQTLTPLLKILQAIFGEHLSLWGILLCGILFSISWRRHHPGILVGAGLLSSTASIAYLLLPEDWMAELRFATLVFSRFLSRWPLCFILGCTHFLVPLHHPLPSISKRRLLSWQSIVLCGPSAYIDR
jgi:hypothetical protein